jgi:hypothetical protein
MRGVKHDFHCGDRVFHVCDPRHVGTVRVIVGGVLAHVEWQPGVWSQFVPLRALVRAPASMI